MAASQSVMKLEKLSNEDWESPKRSHKFSKRKENEDSGDDSEKHSSSEDLDQLTDLIESPDQVIKSKASTDQEPRTIGETTQPDTQQKKEEIQEENVLDMISFKSRYSKNCFETASLKQSIKSSKMTNKDKKQITKAIKKVNFFSLKQESVVDKEDLDSQGMEEAEGYNLEAMNKSIQKQKLGGGMKRNAKSFNFTQKQLTDYITEQENQMFGGLQTP